MSAVITTADYAAMTAEEKIAFLEARNAELSKPREPGKLRLKVSEKGGVSLYGLGRFPVTLYKEQWLRLIEHATEVVEFISDHEAELTVKQR